MKALRTKKPKLKKQQKLFADQFADKVLQLNEIVKPEKLSQNMQLIYAFEQLLKKSKMSETQLFEQLEMSTAVVMHMVYLYRQSKAFSSMHKEAVALVKAFVETAKADPELVKSREELH